MQSTWSCLDIMRAPGYPQILHFQPLSHILTELVSFLQCCLPRRTQFLIPRSWGNVEPEMMSQMILLRRLFPAPADGISKARQHPQDFHPEES